MDHSDLEVASVSVGSRRLQGLLSLPAAPGGIVVFAHGSGSGRLSPRNNHVASGLHGVGLATLLLDLLAPSEEQDRANVFDIALLASRLEEAARWVASHPQLADLPVGFFGASTGAGAALLAASGEEVEVRAIVSRGGRPDLAGAPALARVRAPTLLIVGSLDTPVIALNRVAMQQLTAPTELAIVPGASHLFEEPGTLDQVIALASGWFVRHFGRGS